MNKRIAGISPSLTLGVTSKAKQMKADGIDVCSFAAGEPDFDTPDKIKEMAKEALMAGETKYAPVAGLAALRLAISKKLESENGLSYGPDQTLVSIGAKHSLFNIFMTICDEGEEVVIPAPYWLSYPEMVNVAGGVPVFVEGSEENDYKITADDLEAVITDKTVAVVINSPSNPIGIVYTGDELRALAEVAVRHDIYIVADEIYEKIIYDDAEHVSIGSLSCDIFNKTITVNGFSKAWSMTGWRLGYFAGPLDVVKGATALQSHSTSGATTFAQYGAIEALREDDGSVGKMLEAFAERRSYMYGRLSSMEGVTCVKPMGAFYMLPNISATGVGSLEFCEKLLEEAKVAAVPGAAFGCDKNIRLSYACSMENISEGLDRLEKFMGSL